MKKSYIFFVLLIATLILVVSFSSPVKSHLTSGSYTIFGRGLTVFSDLGKSLKDKITFIFHISDLKKQNNELIDKITQLQVDQSQINELEIENSLLEKELGFMGQSEKGTLIPAKIIEREPTSFLDYFIVDKGKNDNIVDESAVIYNGVLVGQIKEVFDDHSKVVLITSKDSIVQVALQDCRAKGILKGGINGLFMENIVSDTDIKADEYIITSGLGGKMRAGILVGKAGKIQSNSSGIFKSIGVEPIVDLSTLELIFIEKK